MTYWNVEMHNPRWVEIALPDLPEPNFKGLTAVYPIYLYVYMNSEYIVPEPCIVGEIKLRHVYEELPAEYHAWVSDYRTLQKAWIGKFKTLQVAKGIVESTVDELLEKK